MSAVLRINVDATISRKSQNECHSGFKAHTSQAIRLCSYRLRERKSEIVSVGENPDSREILWKKYACKCHGEILSFNAMEHDIVNRSHGAENSIP